LSDCHPDKRKSLSAKAEGLFSFRVLQVYLHKRLNEKSP